MSGLPREVLKWIQSLDLTWQVKTPKWDLTNGYLIAEIFSWYFPQEVEMHMYNNGTSLDSKQRNWSLLQNFFKRHKFDIPEEYIEGTIHCKEGAGPLLVERIYEILTNRTVRKIPTEYEIDFTDRAYQVQLPIHARSTASQAVKNNLRITELMADKNLILGQQKAQSIISDHIEHRRMERVEEPMRFDRKPTLGEMAVRRPPPPQALETEASMFTTDSAPAVSNKGDKRGLQGTMNHVPRKESAVQFKEVQVKQPSASQSIRVGH